MKIAIAHTVVGDMKVCFAEGQENGAITYELHFSIINIFGKASTSITFATAKEAYECIVALSKAKEEKRQK